MQSIKIKTIDTLRIARECTQRFEFCDRRCEVCDLYIPTKDKVKALNVAIAFLDVQRNTDELKGEQ